MADFPITMMVCEEGKFVFVQKLEKEDKKTLVISEVPYGTTTSMIDSILKANDKGKIKIKKVEDNTAALAEVIIHLAPGVSPDKTIDAFMLSRIVRCLFLQMRRSLMVKSLALWVLLKYLKSNTDNTVDLLRKELGNSLR